MFAAFYSIALAGMLSPFLRNLAFGTLATMILFVVFGKAFQSYGGLGQVAFMALGVVFFIFADQITGALNLRLTLVRLSWASPQVSFMVNDSDMTWLLWVGLLVTVYLIRDDIGRWIHGQF